MKPVNTIARYITSLAAVVACYFVYQTFVVPHIDGESIVAQSKRVTDGNHVDPKADIIELFPPHAWELKPCNVLETAQGKLLFQKHDRLDDGRVKITPLTLVVRSSKPDQQPFVIQAEAGAILKFDKPFSFASGIGKIEEGMLNGKVRIYRLSAKLEHDDSIELDTENVQLSPERIFTLSDVAFRFGGSHGRGRNLAIDMFEEDPTKEKRDIPIRKLELAHVDYMHIHRAAVRRRDILNPLDSANQGSFRGQVPDEANVLNSSTSMAALESGSIDVACEGGFQLDVENQVASFKKQVRVQGADGSSELHCDQLWLYFNQTMKNPAPASADLAHAEAEDRKNEIQIQKIVALGQPAKLYSKEQGGYVEAEHLQMDVDTQRVVLRGQRPVQIRRTGQTIIAREMEYVINEDGSLGNTVARGPGTISQQPIQSIGLNGETQIDQHGFQCDWQGRLTILPEGEFKLIEFEARTIVVFDSESRLAGNQIKFWLRETSTTNAAGKQKFHLAPHKLVALGNVSIDSPRISGNCNDLTALWQPSNAQSIGFNRNTGDKVGRRIYTAKVATNVYGPQQDLQMAGESTSARYRFSGRSVEIKLVEPVAQEPHGEKDDRKYEVAELTAAGQVSILQENADGESDALEIRGENLQAINLGNELYRLHINGDDRKPATATGRGVGLSGKTISLDQEFNRLWIDGDGEMMLEKKSEELQEPEKTDLFWDGGMVFDGQTFYVEGNVRTLSRRVRDKGNTTAIETSSQALNAKLNRTISFKEQNGSSELDAELEKIVLAGSIKPEAYVFQVVSSSNNHSMASQNQVSILLNHFGPDEKLTGVQQIAVPDATIDSMTGEVNCTGPGVVQGIQLAGTRGENATGLSSGLPPGLASRPQSKKPLEYVQIKFDRTLEGNLNSNEMTLNGNVRTIYSPADDWNASFDADARTVTDPGAMRLVCDRMQLFQWKPRTALEPTIEMIATGNAQATGQQFKATSHRMSFNQATDKIIFQAGARKDAELFYRNTTDGQEGHLTAETIEYNVANGGVHVDQYKEIDVNNRTPRRDRN